MKPDRLETMLAAHFKAEPVSRGLAGRVARTADTAARELERLLGRLGVMASPRGVVRIRPGRQEVADTAAARRLVERAREELTEYLGGLRAFFSVPVDLAEAPEFQRRVLEVAREIPFGEARPYAWVAERIGHPRAARAVGTALGTNPVPLIIPCHRVLKSDGSAGGYLLGPRTKQRLLDLERRTPVLEGCTSTRIVCRVGCVHGRDMRPTHRVVFASVDDARSVGYRPCKVCKPEAA